MMAAQVVKPVFKLTVVGNQYNILRPPQGGVFIFAYSKTDQFRTKFRHVFHRFQLIIRVFLHRTHATSVSYTHLDVYKRQLLNDMAIQE